MHDIKHGGDDMNDIPNSESIKIRHFISSPMYDRFREYPLHFMVRERVFSEKTEPLHYHDFPQFWYCSSGEYIHSVDGTQYICKPGSIVFVPSGVFHAIYTDCPATLTCVEGTYWFFKNLEGGRFYENMMQHLFLQKFLKTAGQYCVCIRGQERRQAEKILKTLASFDYTRNFSEANMATIRNCVLSLFSFSKLRISEKQAVWARNAIDNQLYPIMESIKYINENFVNKIYLETLLCISAFNQTTFYRLMRKTVGTTYAIYAQRIRISHVRDLVTFGTYTLDYIADRCGFESISYMNRIFKRYYGKTLSEVQKVRKELIQIYPNMVLTQDYFLGGVFEVKRKK